MSADENAGATPIEPGNAFAPVDGPGSGPAPEDAPSQGWASPAADPAAAAQPGTFPQYPPLPGTFPQYPPPLGTAPAPPQFQGQNQFQYPATYQAPPAWDARSAPARPQATPSQHRRRVVAIVVPVVLLAVIGIGLAIKFSSSSSPTPVSAAAASSSPADPATGTGTDPAVVASPSGTAEPVGYFANGTAARNVGIPTFDPAAAQKTYTITIQTNRGNIVFTAVGANAPYTVYNFVYLIQKAYFNNTPCHRLTTSGLYVLQCGDPTGTGSGGPGYAFQDENLNAYGPANSSGTVTYPAGAVAMANSGPDTNGSQFFLVYQDSPLPPNYTPFGTITQGLDVLKSIAAQGTDNSNGSGDG